MSKGAEHSGRSDGAAPSQVPARCPDNVTVSFEELYRNERTARRHAEAALKVADDDAQLYRSLFDRNPDPVFSVDAQGRFTNVNPACEAMSGYSAAELLGMTFLALCAPDQISRTLENFRRALEGRAEDLETALIRKDGARVELLITGGPLLIEGRVVGVHCAAKDITGRKRDQEQWRAVLTRARCILWHATIEGLPGWERDHDGSGGRFKWKIRVSDEQAAQQVLPLKVPEGRPYTVAWHPSKHPDDSPLMDANAAAALIGGQGSYTHEFRCTDRFGRQHWLNEDVSIEPVGHGHWRAVGVVTDVTARKRAEQEVVRLYQDLQRKVTELETLFEVAPIGIAVAHDRACREIRTNPACAAMIGLPPGVNASHTAPLEEWAATYRVYRNGREVSAEDMPMQVAAAGGQTVYGHELDIVRSDGSVTTLFGNAAPLMDEHGRPCGAVGTFIDIGPLKRVEAQLQQAKQCAEQARAAAEAASAAKDRFLAVLSHELRTPLTPVLMTASAMASDVRLDESVRRDATLICRGAELEARLIDDLLDLTKISRGKLELNRATVDAHALLRDVLPTVRADADAKGVAITLDLRATEHHADADAARLQQVFWNLLKNAIKFTPSGGRVDVRTTTAQSMNGATGSVHQGVEPSRGAPASRPLLVIEVADTGIGIEPDALGRIFDAFEQGDASVSRQFGGLGLGLAISKSIAEMHGGHIAATSAGHGQGATFTLSLPTVARTAREVESDPAERDPVAPGVSAREARSLRLLLVEDDAPTVRALVRLLRRSGHAIVIAGSVAEARRASDAAVAAGEPFDLLISDLGLPDGSGLELARDLGARHGLRGIAISGYGMEADLSRSRDAGFIEHLTKPLEAQRLEAAIGRAVAFAPKIDLSPAPMAESNSPEAVANGTPRPAVPTVLVVDDSSAVTQGVCRMLASNGYAFAAFDSATPALEFVANATPPIAAVVDIHLPDLDGLTLAHRLRDRFGPRWPIIILSGDTSMRTLGNLPNGPATCFLGKPVPAAQLLDRLRALLGSGVNV